MQIGLGRSYTGTNSRGNKRSREYYSEAIENLKKSKRRSGKKRKPKDTSQSRHDYELISKKASDRDLSLCS